MRPPARRRLLSILQNIGKCSQLELVEHINDQRALDELEAASGVSGLRFRRPSEAAEVQQRRKQRSAPSLEEFAASHAQIICRNLRALKGKTAQARGMAVTRSACKCCSARTLISPCLRAAMPSAAARAAASGVMVGM